MRYFFIIYLLAIITTFSYGQDSLDNKYPVPSADAFIRQQIEKNTVDTASINRGLESFMQMQQERNNKDKRNAKLRLAFGALMLVVLIVGILRKKSSGKNKSS